MANEQKPDKFDIASSFTFHPNVEGGYGVDNGGPTNYGMRQQTLDIFNEKNGYPKQDVRDISQDYAKHIAKEMFFEEPKLDMLPDRVATAAFDYSYNSGPFQAIKDLQRVVGAKPDGRMGSDTQKAVDTYIKKNGEDALLYGYNSNRANLMSGLIIRDPKQYGQYAGGWSNRMTNLSDYLNLSPIIKESNN